MVSADNTGFLFIGNDIEGEFEETLMDPSTKEFSFIFAIGHDTAVVEQVPRGWVLEEIICEQSENCGEENNEPCINIIEVPNGLTLECLEGQGMATCTFFNERSASSVPTITEWGMIAMAGILGIVGFMVMRRRKATA